MTNEVRVRDGQAQVSDPVQQGHTKQSDMTYRPPVDVYDLSDRYELHVDVPGTSPEHIDVSVHEGVLSIEASVPDRYEGEGLRALHREYGVGDYRRQIRLGEDIDSEALAAEYRLGVLKISLPKRKQPQPRRVEVKGG